MRTFDADLEYFNRIGEQNGFDTRWSIYSDDPDYGFTRMNSVSPFSEGTVIRNKCDVWGYDTSAVVKGPLWIDVWEACNKVITEADDHHIFIEGFELERDGVHIVTGS